MPSLVPRPKQRQGRLFERAANLVEPGESITVASLFPNATVLVVPRLAVAGGGGPVIGDPFFATFWGGGL